MKQVVLRYGIISGAIMGGMLLVTVPFYKSTGFEAAWIFGTTTMVLGFSLIYFALTSLKKQNGGITFWQGFKTGILISLLASVVYSFIWVILCKTAFPNFMTEYGDHMIASAKKSGATGAALEKQMNDVAQMKKIYSTSIGIFLMTMLEPLPVGIVVTIIAALITRTRKKGMQTA